MTNAVGKAIFSKAGELCTEFPKTAVLLDHPGFYKAPENGEAKLAYGLCMKLSRFPQVYVKFMALFRLSRRGFPYEDLSPLLSQLVSHFGANRVIYFPFVVLECGYKEAKEVVTIIAKQASLSSSEMEWIMGKIVIWRMGSPLRGFSQVRGCMKMRYGNCIVKDT